MFGKRIVKLLTLTLLASAGLAAVAAEIEDRGVPTLIDQPGRFGDPLWVAAQSAAPEGRLRRELFSAGVLSDFAFQRQLAEAHGVDLAKATAEEACGVETVTTGAVRFDGLQALFDDAETVLEGVVTGVEPGFHYGHIANLVEVTVTRVRKSSGSAFKRVLVPFRGGRVLVDGVWHCSWPSGRTEAPALGGRILVFADGILAQQPLVLDVGDAGFFFETEEGDVSRPRVARSWSALEAELDQVGAADRRMER